MGTRGKGGREGKKKPPALSRCSRKYESETMRRQCAGYFLVLFNIVGSVNGMSVQVPLRNLSSVSPTSPASSSSSSALGTACTTGA